MHHPLRQVAPPEFGAPGAIPTAIRLEKKRATHDGFIWPRARHLMVVPTCIRERMEEDLVGLIHAAGDFDTVCDDALIALGWTPDQVRRYGAEAARRIWGKNDRTENDHTLPITEEVA